MPRAAFEWLLKSVRDKLKFCKTVREFETANLEVSTVISTHFREGRLSWTQFEKAYSEFEDARQRWLDRCVVIA